MDRNDKAVKERIVTDLATHTITILKHDGLYQHYRCQRPRTWAYEFDIVTWPGFLCVTGDMGEYLFLREPDMIAFMKKAWKDYRYAAEKCMSHDCRIKEWSEDKFRDVLAERAKETPTVRVIRRGEWATEDVSDHIDNIIMAYEEYSSQHDAMKAMYESGLWEGSDLPSCEVWSFHFLWVLHAIGWFCANVDNGSWRK